MGKVMESDQDKAGTDSAVFVSAKSEACRITSKLYGLKKLTMWAKSYQKDPINICCGGEGEGLEV